MVRKKRRWILSVGLGVFSLCMVCAIISALSNLGLPKQSEMVARLSSEQITRLAEAEHLRFSLGDQVWPGWGQADIPLLVYNEGYAFLSDDTAPPRGWRTVPNNETRGDDWSLVNDSSRITYYAAPLPNSDTNPQAFTVRIGDKWAASLGTREWMRIGLRQEFQQQLPSGLDQIFPYRIFEAVFFNSEDWYVAALLHESFHAYQGFAAGGRLENAEKAARNQEKAYPWGSETLEAAWQKELDLLEQALRTEDGEEVRRLTAEFLAYRSARREAEDLTADQIDYEKQREWVEGLAKYVELRIWQTAAESGDYRPVAGMETLPDFDGYQTFERRWGQEVDQINRMAGSPGDGRFYYSGMAQAFLLDRLAADWKQEIFNSGVSLEALLEKAVQTQ